MGPSLKLSRRFGGFKYVIICVCRVTRYVELIPVTSLKATALADALLIHLIARYKCHTLIYDQQSAMMFGLMQSVLKILRIHSQVAVAGLHLMTSIAERMVRKVEDILKSYIFDYRANWHLLLPFIAFNLNQTPCETLGLSPHELTYGRNFDDDLDDIYDELTGNADQQDPNIKKNVLAYLTDLREQIDRNKELSIQHGLAQHAKTKGWYDRYATKNKQFDPGQKVIILQKDDNRKLFGRWSEPCDVVDQLTHVITTLG